MIRDFSDPEGQRQIHAARSDEARRAFKAKEMSEAVFRATLWGLGFSKAEIAGEVRDNWPGDSS